MTAKDKPVRVQLKRTKGWKMPENTVKVDRTSRKFGNPFRIGGYFRLGDNRSYRGPFRMAWMEAAPGYETPDFELIKDAAYAVAMFRRFRCEAMPYSAQALAELRGKNLACWCKLCDAHKNGKPFGVECKDCAPCHSDTLGDLANRGEP